jgi:hypothetical protein
MAALTLNLSSIAKISRSQFRQIANDNPEMKLERVDILLSLKAEIDRLT